MGRPSKWKNLGKCKAMKFPSEYESVLVALLDIIDADIENKNEPRSFNYSQYLHRDINNQNNKYSKHIMVINEKNIKSLQVGDLIACLPKGCIEKGKEKEIGKERLFHKINEINKDSCLYDTYMTIGRKMFERNQTKLFYGEDGIITQNKESENKPDSKFNEIWCKVFDTHPHYQFLLYRLGLSDEKQGKKLYDIDKSKVDNLFQTLRLKFIPKIKLYNEEYKNLTFHTSRYIENINRSPSDPEEWEYTATNDSGEEITLKSSEIQDMTWKKWY